MTTYTSLSVDLETLGKGKLMSKLDDAKEHRKQLWFINMPAKWQPYIYMWKPFGSEIHLVIEFIAGDFNETKRILFMYKKGEESKIDFDPETVEHSSIVILRDGTVCVDEYLSFGYFGGDEFYVSLK